MSLPSYMAGMPHYHYTVNGPVMPIKETEAPEYIDCVHYDVNTKGDLITVVRRVHICNLSNRMLKA